ncbi:hypothetical protein AB6A40_000127 [Gnathostoma spinigerum]|uniref:Uncharacterized protein n=1 Tax=Gnathostoma spinigerum TaxID=75299 RepID=A0ABD6E1I8_9BILA
MRDFSICHMYFTLHLTGSQISVYENIGLMARTFMELQCGIMRALQPIRRSINSARSISVRYGGASADEHLAAQVLDVACRSAGHWHFAIGFSREMSDDHLLPIF